MSPSRATPNIIEVIDSGRLDDGQCYILMEYLEGSTVEALARSMGPLPVDMALAILVQVCSGLAAAHERGIIHRDLKPENIMVGEFGAFNKTPHAVVLRWLEDWLRNWQQAGWGWALWNFRGSFGILGSDRADVQYEAWEGHKLDRKMLELLQKY